MSKIAVRIALAKKRGQSFNLTTPGQRVAKFVAGSRRMNPRINRPRIVSSNTAFAAVKSLLGSSFSPVKTLHELLGRRSSELSQTENKVLFFAKNQDVRAN